VIPACGALGLDRSAGKLHILGHVWLGLTPDFQYDFNPSGESNSDAAVLGGQIVVDF
jgi:hypothetical protein